MFEVFDNMMSEGDQGNTIKMEEVKVILCACDVFLYIQPPNDSMTLTADQYIQQSSMMQN